MVIVTAIIDIGAAFIAGNEAGSLGDGRLWLGVPGHSALEVAQGVERLEG